MNTLRGILENLDEVLVVQKKLTSLLEMFNLKVSSIEEMTSMNSLMLDKLLRTFISNEMRISNCNSTTKALVFKAEKKCKEEHDD